jgi:SsrA-binding protein
MQIINRKARFNYQIIEEIEAGIVLMGSEVKSMRQGKVNISEAYGAESKGEIFLINANISEYKGANRFNHEPKRARKLLFNKKQINQIVGKINVAGLSLIPLQIHFNQRGMAKVLMGIGKGKKLYDKRESIKERDIKRRMSRGEE